MKKSRSTGAEAKNGRKAHAEIFFTKSPTDLPASHWRYVLLVQREQDTIKIGVIMPYSGQFADTAAQMDNAIKLYMKQHGDTVAGKKIELIRKDTGGIAPDVAKRLAQELDRARSRRHPRRVRTHAECAGRCRRVRGSQEIHGGDECGDLDHHSKISIPGAHLDDHAAAQSDARHLGGQARDQAVYTMVSDYGPGIDAEGAFQLGYKEAGGNIVGSVRFPVANPDFSAFVQRAKDMNPEAIYICISCGAQPAAIGKALAERGIDASKGKILGQDVLAGRTSGQEHGRRGVGIITGDDLRLNLNLPMNHESVKANNADFK